MRVSWNDMVMTTEYKIFIYKALAVILIPCTFISFLKNRLRNLKFY